MHKGARIRVAIFFVYFQKLYTLPIRLKDCSTDCFCSTTVQRIFAVLSSELERYSDAYPCKYRRGMLEFEINCNNRIYFFLNKNFHTAKCAEMLRIHFQFSVGEWKVANRDKKRMSISCCTKNSIEHITFFV